MAVVGSGPAGFYAAGALLDAETPIEVDMLERLPTPWGLVRLGVAPDHPKLKTVSRAFERIAVKPGFRFFGNVEVGRDLSHGDLIRLYDAVIYAFGAQSDRRLGIPGDRERRVERDCSALAHAALRSCGFSLAIIDAAQPGRPVVYANPAFCRLTGYDVNELVGKNLDEIRLLSKNYALPEDACASYSLLYRMLDEFEEDLHLHIHLENNILFPKALELEKQA